MPCPRRRHCPSKTHAGKALVAVSTSINGATVIVQLDKESADRLTDGGSRLGSYRQRPRPASASPGPTSSAICVDAWTRRASASGYRASGTSRSRDAELYELLQELDQTLIIDRESAWRIAKPGGVRKVDDGEPEPVRWEDLDWDRVRRDPRYDGYFTRRRAAGLPPD